jgi:hypothetical protein
MKRLFYGQCVSCDTPLNLASESNTLLWLFLVPHCYFINFNYSISNALFESINEPVTELGIMVDCCFNFNATRLDKISCKAMKILEFLLRISMDFKLSSSLKVLFNSFACFILEYEVIIWCLTTMRNSYQLERVQRKYY